MAIRHSIFFNHDSCAVGKERSSKAVSPQNILFEEKMFKTSTSPLPSRKQ